MSSISAYDYICVIDFEATCIEGKDFYPHEIIEFPAVLIDTSKCEIVNTFHSFVKPTLNLELTEFCKNLTGITQNSVNNAETFDCVLANFLEWIDRAVPPKDTFIILTDGSWDISKFLNLQCIISHIEFPSWAKASVDLKSTYKYYHNKSKVKLMDMLNSYGVIFQGKLHSGKDDAFNIAQLVLKMMKCGCNFIANSYYLPSSTKSLKRKLAAYLKKKQKDKCKFKQRHKDGNQSKDLSDVPGEALMDIDPDLIGCESILLKYKRK